MTPREKNLADINEIAQEYGYTVEDVLGYSKPKELVKIRRLCVVMLREKGYSTLAIGRIMHRDHSSICNSLNKSKATGMTPEKLKLARHYMGYSVNEMADALRLSPASGGTTIRKMESGKVNITGPISVAVDAMMKGYDPFDYEDDEYDDFE
jgi:DNA-binding XRE family transcriptional regulator